jgi:hypothetical protein
MLQVIVWTLALAGLLNITAFLPQRPGIAFLLAIVQPGAYLIVASATASAAHERKDLLLIVLLLTALAAYPYDAQELARLLIPLGVGILAGTLLRTTLKQQQHHERTTRPTP